MGVLEGIGGVLDAKRQDVEMLEAGFTRLLVVIERIIGKAEIKRAYSAAPPSVARCGHVLQTSVRGFTGSRRGGLGW